MKLRLTFSQSSVSARSLSEFLHLLDRHIAFLEGESIHEFGAKFSVYPRASIQKGFDRFRTDYEKGRFSMLQLEAVRPGSIVLTFVVKAAAEEILRATIFEDVKESWKKTNSSRQLQKALDTNLIEFFTKALPRTLELAVTRTVEEFKRQFTPSTGSTVQIEEIKPTRTEKCDYLDVKAKLLEKYDGTISSYYEVVTAYNALQTEQESLQTEGGTDNQLRTSLE